MYSEEDKRDAKTLSEWFQKLHYRYDVSVDKVLLTAPRPIKAIIERLTFKHIEITVMDLMDMSRRIIEEK
jgi:hypothetical protein